MFLHCKFTKSSQLSVPVIMTSNKNNKPCPSRLTQLEKNAFADNNVAQRNDAQATTLYKRNKVIKEKFNKDVTIKELIVSAKFYQCQLRKNYRYLSILLYQHIPAIVIG